MTRIRSERKLKARLRLGTSEGQTNAANKRIRKTEKKKDLHREKTLQFALRR